MAQRAGRGIALLFPKTSALDGGEWSAARPSRTLPPGKTRYPLYRRLGGPQGRSGRAQNLALTGIRSPDRPARSQSLYRLSYPAQCQIAGIVRNLRVYHVRGVLKLRFEHVRKGAFPALGNSAVMPAVHGVL